MITIGSGDPAHQIRLALRSEPDGRTDEQLLGSFVDHRDGEAFAALVRRHGPMVIGPKL